VEVTCIYHNCFILVSEGKTLLFDYSDRKHRNDEAEEVVRSALQGADATLFVPMHLFGDPEAMLPLFREWTVPDGTKVFAHRKTGDQLLS